MRKVLFTLTLLTLLGFSPLAQQAQAWGGVRIGIGVPLYVGPGPYYGGYGYGYRYYYPPPYVVSPPPVVYQTAPTVVTVPPVPQPSPLPAPVTQSASFAPLPSVTNVVPVSNQASPQVDALVRQLSQTSETGRRDAAIQLGRMKADGAVDDLVNMLAKDSSPIAREGAARALGLIGAPASLKALIYAAQADNDNEVRHSAQFAVEVIRSSLRGN